MASEGAYLLLLEGHLSWQIYSGVQAETAAIDAKILTYIISLNTIVQA